MDAVVNYLKSERWEPEPELVTKGYPDRPVFSLPARKGVFKVVVGPMWTTYYRLHREAIYDQDSTKTDNLSLVKSRITELVKGER